MIEVAEAINTFPNGEEQIFVLTSSQLRDIVTHAIQEALESLKDELGERDRRITNLEEKTANLAAEQSLQADNQLIQLQLIRDLRPASEPLQHDRAEVLRAIILDHGGKMYARDARRLMHLPKNRFSELLALPEVRAMIGVKRSALENKKRLNILYLL